MMWDIYKRLIISWMGYLLVLTFSSEVAAKKRVCVIGAGPAGLASVKRLADHLDEFEPVVFEKNSDVGGLWIYSDNTGVDQFGLPVHSSMYSNLRTNFPTDVMAFPDYKNLTNEGRSCARYEMVLQYLRNFTTAFNLYQYIRLDTLVEKVSPVSNTDGKDSSWLVSIRHANSKESNEIVCDAVMVCNGHFFKPSIPKIPGIESFPGRIFHSHLYRKAEEFKGQTVVLLGAGTSGPDIAFEISEYAKTIYLSHRRTNLLGKQPSNLIQVPGVVSANGSELTLKDGSKITVDAFIYCTGYLKEYPFLDESSGVEMKNNGKDVGPLYKYLINTVHESMAMVGIIPLSILSFPQFYLQAQYYVAVLQGNIKLPDRTEMLKDIERLDSMPRNMFEFEWAVHREYVKSRHVKPLPHYYETVANLWLRHLYNERFYFKDYNVRIDAGRPTIYKIQSRNVSSSFRADNPKLCN